MSSLSRNQKFGLAGIFMLVVLLTWWRDGIQPPGDTPVGSATRQAASSDVADAKTKSGVSSRNSTRVRQLEELKKRWLEIGPGQGNYEKRRALSQDSAEQLLASPEALELMEFLADREIQNMISGQVKTLFSTSVAAESRSLLVTLPDERTHWDSTNYKEEWSYSAGLFCPEEELQDFCKALKSEGCSQEAMLAYHLRLARTDPHTAIRLTIDIVKRDIKTRSRSLVLVEQLGLLPDTSDFAAIDELFPPSSRDDHTTPYNRAREVIFEKWAQSDPVAAANRIIDVPDRYNPDLLSIVAKVVVDRNKDAGVAWVRTFPEGPYFDAAAKAAIYSIGPRYPEEAKDLAEMIKNAEVKDGMLRYIAQQRDRDTEEH